MSNDYLIARRRIRSCIYINKFHLRRHLLVYSDNNTVKNLYFSILQQHIQNNQPFVILNNFGFDYKDIISLNQIYSAFNPNKQIEVIDSDSNDFIINDSKSYILNQEVSDNFLIQFFTDFYKSVYNSIATKNINQDKNISHYLLIFGEYRDVSYIDKTFMQGQALTISGITHTTETNNSNIFRNVFFNSYIKILLYPYSLKFSTEIIKLDKKKRFINIFSPIYKNNFIISNHDDELKIF